MDISTLVRDPARVHACLQEFPDGTIVTKKKCKIYIPVRFEAIDLAEVGIETHIVGLFAIVYEDGFYGVMNVNAMMRISPAKIEKIKIGHTEYYEFSFGAGGVVIQNYNLFMQDVLVYDIYNELISAGKVPWYLTYEDLGSLFDTAPDFAGANIGENAEITELLVSSITRDPNDRTKYYRTLAKDPENLNKVKPSYIPLRSVIFAATNTTNKLAGSYMQVGVVSALVTPSTNVEKIEELLRR